MNSPSASWTVRYTGGPILAGLVGRTFEENGLQVRWEQPPMEQRGMASDMAQSVVSSLIATGTVEAMKAGFAAARERVAPENLEIDPPLDDERGDDGERSEPEA